MRALVFGYGQRKDGTIDEQTEDRCRKALWLYRNAIARGDIGKIYLTVSASKNGVSMASAMREFLVGQKVEAEDIVVNPRGGNTAGEMNIFLWNLPPGQKAVFISTWYHIPRILWLALWRIRPTRFVLGVAWRHVHFRTDVLVEFAKLANAIMRPRSSAKIVELNVGFYDRNLFLDLTAESSISAQQFEELDHKGLIR